MVEAFGMKLWWRFREQNSLWANFMLMKYCSKTGPVKVVANKNHSPIWRRMVKASTETHKLTRWSIGDGKVEFWDDIWLKDQEMRVFCDPEAPIRREQVKDFWIGNTWNLSKLRQVLIPRGVPYHIIDEISKVPIEEGSKDILRWEATHHGNFSTTSAWNICRNHHSSNEKLEHTWNAAISPSISIFMWRLLENRIPVEIKMQKRGIQLESKCVCCRKPGSESREHLFIQSEPARRIWRYFATWFPDDALMEEDDLDLNHRLHFWYSKLPSPTAGHVRIIIPLLIFWSLWTERNNTIHRVAKFSTTGVIERIILHLQWGTSGRKINKQQWSGSKPEIPLTSVLEDRSKQQRTSEVKWDAPEIGWIKVNTAGVLEDQQGQAGGAGVIRDSRGQILEGFVASYMANSILEAELQIINIGLDRAKRRGTQIWIETRSLKALNILTKGSKGPAETRHIAAAIRVKLKADRKKITHIEREGNKIADWLAKQAHNQQMQRTFDQESAPLIIKEMALAETIGSANAREDQEGDS